MKLTEFSIYLVGTFPLSQTRQHCYSARMSTLFFFCPDALEREDIESCHRRIFFVALGNDNYKLNEIRIHLYMCVSHLCDELELYDSSYWFFFNVKFQLSISCIFCFLCPSLALLYSHVQFTYYKTMQFICGYGVELSRLRWLVPWETLLHKSWRITSGGPWSIFLLLFSYVFFSQTTQ